MTEKTTQDETSAERVKNVLDQLTIASKTVNAAATNFENYIAHNQDKFKHLHELVPKVVTAFTIRAEQLGGWLESMPKDIEFATVRSAECGWFLDANMSIPTIRKITHSWINDEAKTSQHIDEYLASYFRDRLDPILNKLIELSPPRAQLFLSIFKAHSIAEYNLSVPVALAQADGLCFENLGSTYFSKKRDGSRATAEFVRAEDNEWRACMLSALKEHLPITKSSYEREVGFNQLNRHQVLHGESLDYGTETNSLKAISFLLYIATQTSKE